MEKQPSFYRSLFIPIGVAIFSLLGICIILVGGRILASPGATEEVPTSTPFQYVFIGTEPAISTVTMDETLVEAPTEAPTEAPIGLPTEPAGTQSSLFTNTPPSLITLPPIANTGTATKTPTSAFTAPFGAGTYDDVDIRFVYNGNWDQQSCVNGLRIGNTLHVSRTRGQAKFTTWLYTGRLWPGLGQAFALKSGTLSVSNEELSTGR